MTHTDPTPAPASETKGETRDKLTKLVDWLYEDDSESLPIEQVEADLKEAGVDMERAKQRLKELLDKYRDRHPVQQNTDMNSPADWDKMLDDFEGRKSPPPSEQGELPTKELPDAPGAWERKGDKWQIFVKDYVGLRFSGFWANSESKGLVEDLPRGGWHPAPASTGEAERPCNLLHCHCASCGCAITEDDTCNCPEIRSSVGKLDKDLRSQYLLEIGRLRKCETRDITTIEELEKDLATARAESARLAKERDELREVLTKARVFVGRAWTNSPMGSANEQGLHEALRIIDVGLLLSPPAAGAGRKPMDREKIIECQLIETERAKREAGGQ